MKRLIDQLKELELILVESGEQNWGDVVSEAISELEERDNGRD